MKVALSKLLYSLLLYACTPVCAVSDASSCSPDNFTTGGLPLFAYTMRAIVGTPGMVLGKGLTCWDIPAQEALVDWHALAALLHDMARLYMRKGLLPFLGPDEPFPQVFRELLMLPHDSFEALTDLGVSSPGFAEFAVKAIARAPQRAVEECPLGVTSLFAALTSVACEGGPCSHWPLCRDMSRVLQALLGFVAAAGLIVGLDT